MCITYCDTKKDLPSEQLHQLFMAVGWSDGSGTAHILQHFNAPFIHSTLVVSAWEDEHLVGCIRVLSDHIIRSVIYDLAVEPAYQNQGIGKELIKRCMAHFPDSQWLVGTTHDLSGYYQKLGFQLEPGVFLSIASKWF